MLRRHTLARALFAAFSLLLIPSFADQVLNRSVRIKGEKLLAGEVLRQVERQTGCAFEFKYEDAYGYKNSYNHVLQVRDVLEEFKTYHRNCNGLDLELVKLGMNRYAFLKRNDPAGLEMSPMSQIRKIGQPEKPLPAQERRQAAALPQAPAKTEMALPQGKGQMSSPKPAKPDSGPMELFPEDDKAPAARTFAKKPGQKDLDVEILGSDREQKPSFLSHFPFLPGSQRGGAVAGNKKASQKAAAEPAAREGAPSIRDRMNRLDKMPAIGLDTKETHFFAFPLGGMLTGFMPSPILPSRLMEEKRHRISIMGSFQKEDKSEKAKRFGGRYKSDLYCLQAGARRRLLENLDVMVEAPAFVHDGDFWITGLSDHELDVAIGDPTAGLDFDAGPMFLEDSRVVLGMRLKLGTGSHENMAGTRHTDAGFYGAYNVEIARNTLGFVQAGFTSYGDNLNYLSLKIRDAFSCAAGAEHYLWRDFSVNAMVAYQQSPVKADDIPAFIRDDLIRVQAGAYLQRVHENLGLELSAGLSESVPEFAAALHSSWDF